MREELTIKLGIFGAIAKGPFAIVIASITLVSVVLIVTLSAH